MFNCLLYLTPVLLCLSTCYKCYNKEKEKQNSWIIDLNKSIIRALKSSEISLFASVLLYNCSGASVWPHRALITSITVWPLTHFLRQHHYISPRLSPSSVYINSELHMNKPSCVSDHVCKITLKLL